MKWHTSLVWHQDVLKMPGHEKIRKLTVHPPPSVSMSQYTCTNMFIHKSATAACLLSRFSPRMMSLLASSRPRPRKAQPYLHSRRGSNGIDGVHSTTTAACIIDDSTVLRQGCCTAAGHRWSQQEKQWHQLEQRSPDRKRCVYCRVMKRLSLNRHLTHKTVSRDSKIKRRKLPS